MVIRSQNKDFIINFEKVDTVCLGGIEDKSIITFTYSQVVTLGEYSTKEKAIKVLDRICEHAEAMHFSIIEPEHCGKLWGNVFDMPQDDEVN